MTKRGLTRRFFIGSALSFGAFGGCRFLTVPSGSASSGTPNLTFGMLSDIHILGANAAPDEFCDLRGDAKVFRAALEWLRDRQVDAVMISGDLADYGMVEELDEVAKAWEAVFPGNRAPDGRVVEKLFTSGNHEINGFLYDDYAKVKFPDPVERRKHVLRGDFARHWERILGEPYAHFFRKEVKGYTFLSTHWGDDTDMSVGWCKNLFGVELQEFLDKRGNAFDPSQPFFYFQHPHLKDTCFGPWAWGRDDGKSTAALSRFGNAVAFSGHAHYPLTDERAIWQGAFTSVGAPSLRFAEMPKDARRPGRYEDERPRGDSPQGMLVKVFDDRIVISRHEFPSGASLGDDWVIPTGEDRPYAFAARARKSKAPQFADDARLTVRRAAAFELEFPPATAEREARVYEYEVVATGRSGETKTFHVLASGFNRPQNGAAANGKNRLSLAAERVPKDVVRFSVTPLDCWWNRGREISERMKA